MKNLKVKRLVLSAMLLAVGVVLPMLTSQIKEIGDTLLPMHIPVLLCGFICSWKYGGAVGLILPFIRSLIFSMPPLYPNAVWMALELMTYGIVAGLVYSQTRKKYMSLIVAMLSGRIVWGIAKAVLLGVAGKSFTISAFITGGFVDAVPGIVIQLVLIPLIIKAYEKNNKA
ncbi:MAG: ECF transporter S component [Clostridia bacterium]|nr:ECF transporter S component [Clostridia bacterium]